MKTCGIARTVGILSAGWIVCLAACAAVAQEVSEAVRQDVDPLQISVDAGVGWTDNRDSAVDDLAEANTDVYVSPRFDFIGRSEAGLLDFSYTPTYRFRENPNPIQNETEWMHHLTAMGEYNPSRRLRLSLADQFDVTDDPAIDKDGSNLRRDASFTMNQIDGSIGMVATRAAQIMVGANHMIKSYDDETRARESDEDKVGGNVRYMQQVARTLILSGIVDMSSYGYEKSTVVNRDFAALLVGGGVSKVFRPELTVTLRGGMSSVDYSDAAMSGASAPFVQASAQVTPSERTGLRLDYVYALREADVYPFASQKRSKFDADLSYAASQAITVGVMGTYRVGEYDTEAVPPGTTAADFAYKSEGTETATILSGYMGYALDQDTTLKLVQDHENVDSDVSTTFTRNATKLMVSRHF